MTFHAQPACPFCKREGPAILSTRSSATAEYNPAVVDVAGSIRSCQDCGIVYCDVGFDPAVFSSLYALSLGNHSYFDDTLMQRARRAMLVGFIRRQWRDPVSRALHVPLHSRIPATMLDVGCGFGEFAQAYAALGTRSTGTEVIPVLVETCRGKGLDCLLGDLTDIDLHGRYDLILFRGVFYRTPDPAATLVKARDALAEGGELSMVDPCVDTAGVEFFAHKQFPQGRFYIADFEKYAAMLKSRFGLQAVAFRQDYGRPGAALRKNRVWGNISGFAELVLGNILFRKPYLGAYLLRRVA